VRWPMFERNCQPNFHISLNRVGKKRFSKNIRLRCSHFGKREEQNQEAVQ
jgi:hypothetical protein